eukprot:1193086-Prorocentrum_minimum.AAC.5
MLERIEGRCGCRHDPVPAVSGAGGEARGEAAGEGTSAFRHDEAHDQREQPAVGGGRGVAQGLGPNKAVITVGVRMWAGGERGPVQDHVHQVPGGVHPEAGGGNRARCAGCGEARNVEHRSAPVHERGGCGLEAAHFQHVQGERWLCPLSCFEYHARALHEHQQTERRGRTAGFAFAGRPWLHTREWPRRRESEGEEAEGILGAVDGRRRKRKRSRQREGARGGDK